MTGVYRWIYPRERLHRWPGGKSRPRWKYRPGYFGFLQIYRASAEEGGELFAPPYPRRNQRLIIPSGMDLPPGHEKTVLLCRAFLPLNQVTHPSVKDYKKCNLSFWSIRII